MRMHQDEQQPTAGEAMVAELKWVHDLIRRDLRTVRQLAGDLSDGVAGSAAAGAIESLQVGGPLWQLKINCLQNCRFLHSHHHAESVLLFPHLRRATPAPAPSGAQFEADPPPAPDPL